MIDKRDLGHIEFTETSTETDYDVQDWLNTNNPAY